MSNRIGVQPPFRSIFSLYIVTFKLANNAIYFCPAKQRETGDFKRKRVKQLLIHHSATEIDDRFSSHV